MVLLLICWTLGAQDTPAFRTSVNLANITAVVRSTSGKLLPDVSKEEFDVVEDGDPQDIKFFARKSELPLSLGLVVDVSGSQEHFLKQHDRDIQTFLREVLRPKDQAFAVCFGNHLRLVSDFTSSIPELMDGFARFAKGSRNFPEIGPLESRDLGTAFYDAIYFSAKEKLASASAQRRALIVFSDGEDNSSEHDLLDAIEAAQSADSLVYCIRYTRKEHGKTTARNRYGMRAIKHIADQTGAADYDGLATSLPEVFVSIGEELRSLYEIGYVSTHAQGKPGFRTVTVRCRRPDSIVRAKSGYYVR